jgi:hypothetical protein
VRLSNIVLTALAVAVCVPSVGSSQYAPQWHVGDWWVVKERCTDMRGGRHWQHRRYDVLKMEKVDGQDCLVLQRGDTASPGNGPRTLYYVRSDNWKIVREVDYFWQQGQLVGPSTFECPQGMFGPLPGEPHLPLFPLDTVIVRDSTFREYHVARSWAWLRQSSGLADSALLKRWLTEPDTLAGRPVPPGRGRMFSVLCELGVPRDSSGPAVRYAYSLQLWSEDLPWRLYEERGQYVPPGSSTRYVDVRTWLIRHGRSGR